MTYYERTQGYEADKAELKRKGLDDKEYELEIKKLADKWDI